MPRPALGPAKVRVVRRIAANRQASSGTGFAIPSLPFWGCQCPKVCGNPADGATCPVRRKHEGIASPAVLRQTVRPLAGRDLQSRPYRFGAAGALKFAETLWTEQHAPSGGRICNPVPTILMAAGALKFAETLWTGQHAPSGVRASSGTGFAIPSPPFCWLPVP